MGGSWHERERTGLRVRHIRFHFWLCHCVALRKLLNITEPVYSSIQVRLLTRFTWLGWVPAKWGGAGEPLVECLVRTHIWCLFIPFISFLGKNGSGKMNGWMWWQEGGLVWLTVFGTCSGYQSFDSLEAKSGVQKERYWWVAVLS